MYPGALHSFQQQRLVLLERYQSASPLNDTFHLIHYSSFSATNHQLQTCTCRQTPTRRTSIAIENLAQVSITVVLNELQAGCLPLTAGCEWLINQTALLSNTHSPPCLLSPFTLQQHINRWDLLNLLLWWHLMHFATFPVANTSLMELHWFCHTFGFDNVAKNVILKDNN